MRYQINPILIEIAKNFKAAHTSEPDSVAAIALMIALNWRTDMEPYLPTADQLAGSSFYMPEKMALKFRQFLMGQGRLLAQLKNDQGFYHGDYTNVLATADEGVNSDFTLKDNPSLDSDTSWDWSDYAWPQFTFVEISIPEAINKKKLFKA